MKKEESNFLTLNIRHLRKLKEWTQQDAADQFEIKKSTYAAYEEGRAIPPYTTILKMAELYKLTIDILVSKDLTISSNLNDLIDVGGQRLLFPITIDKEDNEMIDVVPVKASAGYLSGYSDPTFIRALPKIQFPFKQVNGTGRLFQIKGDSMLPIPSESYIITEYIADKAEIKDGECYILVTLNDGIVYKRVKKHINKLELISDNIEYEPYTIYLAEVKEIWLAKGFMSFELPDHTSPEENLANEIAQIKRDISLLKRKL